MLIRYPILDTLEVKRAGQSWWACDVASCTNEVQVDSSSVPDGWVTSDPDDDVLQGAAQFCPDHSSRVSEPPVTEPV